MLHLIASGSGRDSSIPIHQDADIYVARLTVDDFVEHHFAPTRSGWVQLIEGEVAVNGKILGAGDGAAIGNEERLSFMPARDSHFLFFDLN